MSSQAAVAHTMTNPVTRTTLPRSVTLTPGATARLAPAPTPATGIKPPPFPPREAGISVKAAPDFRTGARHAHKDAGFARQHTPTAFLPDPTLWLNRFSTALLECLDGKRPPGQLARHLDLGVFERVSRRHRTAARRGSSVGPTKVLRIRICEPADGVVEAALVTRIGGRPTPIALRLNGADGRWLITVMEIL